MRISETVKSYLITAYRKNGVAERQVYTGNFEQVVNQAQNQKHLDKSVNRVVVEESNNGIPKTIFTQRWG